MYISPWLIDTYELWVAHKCVCVCVCACSHAWLIHSVNSTLEHILQHTLQYTLQHQLHRCKGVASNCCNSHTSCKKYSHTLVHIRWPGMLYFFPLIPTSQKRIILIRVPAGFQIIQVIKKNFFGLTTECPEIDCPKAFGCQTKKMGIVCFVNVIYIYICVYIHMYIYIYIYVCV